MHIMLDCLDPSIENQLVACNFSRCIDGFKKCSHENNKHAMQVGLLNKCHQIYLKSANKESKSQDYGCKSLNVFYMMSDVFIPRVCNRVNHSFNSCALCVCTLLSCIPCLALKPDFIY